jgi:hypothetical protein
MKYTLLTIKEIEKVFKYEVMISCSLFKMFKGYKDFEKEYFNKLLGWIDKVEKNTYVRLYVDTSVIDLPGFDKLMDKKNRNLEIICFQFDEFLMEDGVHHDGTFGSIVRFLPFYKQFRPKNIKYVWVSDIDVYPRVFSGKNISNMIKDKADVSYISLACYGKPWIFKDNDYPIVTYRLIINVQKVNLNFKDFETYLSDVIKNKYADIYEQIKQYSIDNNELNRIPIYEYIKYFPYGFDELFVNKYYPKVLKFYKRRIALVLNLYIYKDILKDDKEKYKEYMKLHKLSWDLEHGLGVKGKKRLLELSEEIYENVKDDESKNWCLKNLGSIYTDINYNDVALSSIKILNPKK